MHVHLDRWLFTVDMWLIRIGSALPRVSWRLFERGRVMMACLVLLLACLFHAGVYQLALSAALFLSPSQMMDIPFNLLFLPWDLYDLFIVKRSNEGLVVDVPELSSPTGNSESDWGFGQIFPLIMMLSLLMNFIDSWISKPHFFSYAIGFLWC